MSTERSRFVPLLDGAGGPPRELELARDKSWSGGSSAGVGRCWYGSAFLKVANCWIGEEEPDVIGRDF